MNFELSDSQRLIEETAKQLATSMSADYWREADSEGRFPVEFAEKAAEAGLFGTMIPEEYGGAGLGVLEAALILRAIADSDAGLDGCSVVHMGMFGINPILRHGSEEQRLEYLPKAAKGELHTCFAVTEPDAGLDTSRITTFAKRDDDGYLINGRKVWISRAQEASMILLLCRTESYASVTKKADGMTLLFVPRDEETVTLREIKKMGRRAVDSNEMFIDGLRAGPEALVGEEGKGFYHLLDGLNPERVMVAAEAVGVGYQVISRASQYARERRVFGRAIGRNQGVQLPLADAYSQLRAAELLVFEAAWRYDNGLSAGAAANMAKVRASEAAHIAVNVAFETFGGYGFAEEYDIARFYRQLPLTRVAPVTNNLAKAFIAERVLGLPKSYGPEVDGAPGQADGAGNSSPAVA
jgi:acyl-CoA dehydrogenase